MLDPSIPNIFTWPRAPSGNYQQTFTELYDLLQTLMQKVIANLQRENSIVLKANVPIAGGQGTYHVTLDHPTNLQYAVFAQANWDGATVSINKQPTGFDVVFTPPAPPIGGLVDIIAFQDWSY